MNRLWLPRIPAADRSRTRHWFRLQRLRLAGFHTQPTLGEYQARVEKLRTEAAKTFSENNREATDDYFIKNAIVGPAKAFGLRDESLDQLARHNLLIALGSGDFRLYLALQLLEGLEGQM